MVDIKCWAKGIIVTDTTDGKDSTIFIHFKSLKSITINDDNVVHIVWNSGDIKFIPEKEQANIKKELINAYTRYIM